MDCGSCAAACGESCIPEEGSIVLERKPKGLPAGDKGENEVHIPLHCVDVEMGSHMPSTMGRECSELDIEGTSLCTADAFSPYIKPIMSV
jgi:hypothetical protein